MSSGRPGQSGSVDQAVADGGGRADVAQEWRGVDRRAGALRDRRALGAPPGLDRVVRAVVDGDEEAVTVALESPAQRRGERAHLHGPPGAEHDPGPIDRGEAV